MGIELYWDNDVRTVMLVEVDGSWTWDEMYGVLDKIKKVTDNADTTIAAILDLSRGLSFPGGALFTKNSYDHAKRVLQMSEGGTGPVMIVGANRLIKMVYDTFKRLDSSATSNVRFTESVDEARAQLIALGYAYEGEEVPTY